MFIACVGPRSWAAIGKAEVHVHARTQEACGGQVNQELRTQLNLCQLLQTQMEPQNESMLAG